MSTGNHTQIQRHVEEERIKKMQLFQICEKSHFVENLEAPLILKLFLPNKG